MAEDVAFVKIHAFSNVAKNYMDSSPEIWSCIVISPNNASRSLRRRVVLALRRGMFCLLVIYACMSARSEENKAAADREFLTQRLPFETFFSFQICRCRSGTVHFREQHSQPDTCTSRKTSPYCTSPFRHQLQHDTRTLNRSLTASTGWHK